MAREEAAPRLETVGNFNPVTLLWTWLPIALLASLPYIASSIFSPASFMLEIEADVSDGQALQIYLDNDVSFSPSLPVVPGQVHKYQFRNIPASTTALRIDPGERPGSRIRLLAARTFRNQELVKEVIFNQDASFRCWNCDALEPSADSTSFIAASNDPIYYGEFVFQAKRSDRIWARLGGQLSTAYLMMAIACGLILLLVPMSPRRFSNWIPGIPLLLLPAFVHFLSLFSSFLQTLIVTAPDYSRAVGYSTFIGRPKQDETYILLILVTVAVLLSTLCFMLVKKICKRDALPQIALPVATLHRGHNIFLGAVLAGIALINFPPLGSTLNALAQWKHPANWDAQCLGAWRYAMTKELLPYHDFWFPYGGAWKTNGPFIADQFRFFVHCFITYGSFFVLLFILSGARIIATLLFTALLWWGVQDGYLSSLSRYLLSANVLLFYLVLLRQHVSHWAPYVLFGLYVAWVFSYESVLAVYGGLPVFMLFLLQIIQHHNAREWRQWFFRGHAIALAAGVLGIGAFLLALYRDGQLPGFIEFHRDLSAISLIAAVPGDLAGWLQLSTRADSLVIVSLLFGLLWGVWLILWYWKKPEQWLGLYLFLFSCLNFAIYCKYLVRPDMENQFLVVPLIGLFLYITAVLPAFSTSGAHQFLLRLCAVLLVVALYFSPVGNVAASLKQRIDTLPLDIRALFVDASVLSETESRFYAPNTFTDISPRAPAIYEYIQDLRKTVTIDSIYVLGHDQYLYMLLGERLPFYLTVWEGGTQRAQMRTLRDFAAAPPDIIFYNPANRSFDGVPDQVRAPRIYQYVVQNYKVIGSVDNYVVLGRRPEDEKIDVRRWAELLGRDVFLGFIPGSTSFAALPGCEPETAPCGDYLVVTLAQDPGNATVTSFLSTKFGDFNVTWSTRANQVRYEVPLLRLWFWPIVAQAQEQGDWKISTAEATFEVVRRGHVEKVLY